jgi:amino acid adenylation domain-containing protein
MLWNSREAAQADAIATAVAAHGDVRRTSPAEPVLTLRLSSAGSLKAGLAHPRNHGALIIRHLFDALHFDETRIFGWRLDHKLVQALVLNRFCPECVPVTRGLRRELSDSSTRTARRRRLLELQREGLLFKSALGEASGDRRAVDAFQHVIEDVDDVSDELWDERFLVQERLRIRQEYRIHSFEDRVVPELTFYRYGTSEMTDKERDASNEFAQQILDRLPAALVKDTLYGWDIAVDASGRWFALETNPAGLHPQFRPGFHCSGFLQTAPWGPPSVARLFHFIRRHYDLPITIEIDATDDEPEVTSAYWWAGKCAELLDVVGSPTSSGASSGTAIDPRLAPEQNIFAWALTQCRGVVERRAIERSEEALATQPTANDANDVDDVNDANDTARPYPSESIHQLFEAVVERQPEAPAVTADDDVVTYRQLNERAERLAHHLRTIGVVPETRVAVCMPRSIHMVAALLGVMKAGGAYVPLDPEHPAERLSYMLRDSQANVLLTTDALCDRWSSFEGTVVSVDRADAADSPGEAIGSNSHWTPSADHLAYVIYTSGSTGRPKAVAVTHGSLTNIIWDLQQQLGASARDRWLAVTTISFDIAAVELYLPLITGACVSLAKSADGADGRRLAARLAETGANVMQATPSTWQLLIDAGWIGNPSFTALCGGEALPRALARALAERSGATWNLYGPTETTIWSSVYRVSGKETRMSIGRPAANTQMHVLGDDMHAQPPEAEGELYIGGDGVARGYLNLPALTAERFVPDPFSGKPGTRLYRTGDLGRWRNGQLEVAGRLDHQVKVNGVRIELEEVEEALRQHPQISEAAVVARDDAAGRKRLAAYVVHGPGQQTTMTAVQGFLRARLPGPMVPDFVVALDALPHTGNNKIDRKALPWPPPPSQVLSPERSRPSSGESGARGPRTETEAALARIWSTVLSVEDVDIDETFLDLGGHSILAIQCLNRVSDVFDVSLSPITLFVQTPSVRAMANMIDECLLHAQKASR